jgi:oxygen-independent coproporphyrinogen-3 oxidase
MTLSLETSVADLVTDRPARARIFECFGIDFDSTFAPALQSLRSMEADGLVTHTPDAVHVRPPGRLLVRNVAMAFDVYWQAEEDQPVHAQTV